MDLIQLVDPIILFGWIKTSDPSQVKKGVEIC
jgi:hypothetical protein